MQAVHDSISRPDNDAEALYLAYQAALLTSDGEAMPPCEELAAILKKAVESEVPLSTLDLREVKVGRKGARALAAVLQADSFITFANLEGTDVGDEGVAAICDSLHTHPTIFRLDLGYNEITGKGIKAIATLLLASNSLLCLDLSGNDLYSLGESRAGRLAGGLSMIAPASFSALAPLGTALSSPRCKLQLLHLEKADIEHKNLGALVDGLLANETVVNLRLGENKLNAKAAEVPADGFRWLLIASYCSRVPWSLWIASECLRVRPRPSAGARPPAARQPHAHVARPARERAARRRLRAPRRRAERQHRPPLPRPLAQPHRPRRRVRPRRGPQDERGAADPRPRLKRRGWRGGARAQGGPLRQRHAAHARPGRHAARRGRRRRDGGGSPRGASADLPFSFR